MSNWPNDIDHENILEHENTIKLIMASMNQAPADEMYISATRTSSKISNPVLPADVDELNRRQREMSQILKQLERRISVLEHPPNVTQYGEIEQAIKRIFSSIYTIKEVYIKPAESELLLTLIHDSEYISVAIEQAQPGLIMLEDEFPDVYFDTRFFHLNEIPDMNELQSKLVFKCKND